MEFVALFGRFMLGVFVVWVVPLTMATAGLLRSRPYGWWVLIVHAALGCLIWVLATGGSVRHAVQAAGLVTYFRHDPRIVALHYSWYSLSYLSVVLPLLLPLALLVFSVLTVWWLHSDPPGKWTQPASR